MTSISQILEQRMLDGGINANSVNTMIDLPDTSDYSLNLSSNNITNQILLDGVKNSGSYANSAYLKVNSAYQLVNSTIIFAQAAFDASNNSSEVLGMQFANSASLYANSAYLKANSAGSYANSAFLYANSAFNQANNSGFYASGAYIHANTASQIANNGLLHAISAFELANTFTNTGGNATDSVARAAASVAGNTATQAFDTANSATLLAQSAFDTANTKLSSVPNADTQLSSLGVGTAASGTTGEIRATNEVTAYYSSDERLKENIEEITDALSKVKQLRGVMFDWKDEVIESRGGEDGYFVRKHDTGVIAQEVEQVLPELVVTRDDGYKAVKYEKIVGLLIQAINELSDKIENINKVN